MGKYDPKMIAVRRAINAEKRTTQSSDTPGRGISLFEQIGNMLQIAEGIIASARSKAIVGDINIKTKFALMDTVFEEMCRLRFDEDDDTRALQRKKANVESCLKRIKEYAKQMGIVCDH